jgi:hypothetical protein
MRSSVLAVFAASLTATVISQTGVAAAVYDSDVSTAFS